MSYKRKFKRNFQRNNGGFHKCCGLSMEIKVMNNKAYYCCTQCGKVEMYKNKEEL